MKRHSPGRTGFPVALLAAAMLPQAVHANAQRLDEVHVYELRIDEKLAQLHVRACFADGLPVQLVVDHGLATQATTAFRYRINGETVIAHPGSRVHRFPHPSDDDCVEWSVDLGAIAGANHINLGYRTGDSLLLAPGTWFWRPSRLTADRDIEFRVELPKGMQISVPWQPVPGDPHRYRHGNYPLDWPALMAIGALQTDVLDVAGGQLRLAVTDGPAKTSLALVRRWLHSAALAGAELHGEFPVPGSVQVLVIPWHQGQDAAPWAQSNRGGGPGIHFLMNASADESEFVADWIATHEFAHLALPVVSRRDAWLSEGFASYYQHVLRARAGLISDAEAWQALQADFVRGNRYDDDATLQEDSRNLHATGRFMRVYWTGAAIAFKADVELRRLSGNAWSLDRVLQEFDRCCRKPERAWSGRELFEKFDVISNTDVFTTLHREHVHSRHFPRLDSTWSQLAIEVRGVGELRFHDGDGHDLRKAIMASKRAP